MKTSLKVPQKKRRIRSYVFRQSFQTATSLAEKLHIPRLALAVQEYVPKGRQPMTEVVIAREYVDVTLLRAQTTQLGPLCLADTFTARIRAKVVVFTTENSSLRALNNCLSDFIRP